MVKKVGSAPGVRVEVEGDRLLFELTDPVKIEEFKEAQRRAMNTWDDRPEWLCDVMDLLDDVPQPRRRPQHGNDDKVFRP